MQTLSNIASRGGSLPKRNAAPAASGLRSRSSFIPFNRALFVEEGQSSRWLQPEDGDLGNWPLGVDILGVGQAMVDINATVSEDVLGMLELPQGGRRVLSSIDERSDVLATLGDEDCPTELSAGGSLANTLYAIGQLNRAAEECSCSPRSLSVSMTGSCGDDHMGQFFASQMARGGVAVDNVDGGPTGTVLVLTDNSGERSFLSYFGDANDLQVSSRLQQAVSQSKLVVIEGYLWEMPGAQKAILEIIQAAQMAACQVAMTCGDAGVVKRHRHEIREVMAMGVDMMFCNKQEAIELIDDPSCSSVEEAACQLGSLVGTAVVTDGADGSCIGFMGRVYQVQPAEAGNVVSTNGAGDAYCGGFLFALSHGIPVAESAGFASEVAASVVSRHMAQLCEEDAMRLVGRLALQQSFTSSSVSGFFASCLP